MLLQNKQIYSSEIKGKNLALFGMIKHKGHIGGKFGRQMSSQQH
jgi:hypothetical protein